LQLTFWLISSQRQVILIRKKLFQSILKQDISWFDSYKTGELNNMLTEYSLYIYIYNLKIIHYKIKIGISTK
jgi:ABC-type multidrug transport system fused ATPase/permease subunit